MPFGDEIFAGMISSPSSANKAVGWFRYVSSTFSHTLGLTLTEGRDFTDNDYLGKSDGVIVNEMLARSFWRNETALGKRISVDSDQAYTVVGVHKDFRDGNRQTPIAPEIYFPFGREVTSFASAMIRVRPPVNLFIPVIRDETRSEL